MSRYASKEAFGIYAYGTFCWGIAFAVAGCGYTTLLVQKHTDDPDDYAQAHWLSIRVAFVLALLLAVGGELISAASGLGSIRHSLLLFAAAIAIDGYAAVPEAKLLREEKHQSLVKADTLSLAISLVACAVPLIGLKYGNYAPAAYFLGTRAIRTWILARDRSVRGLTPKRCLRLPLVSRLALHFAGIKLVYQLTANIDQLIVGLLLGPAQLGVYNRASAIAKTGIGAIGNVVDRVLFPRLSRLQIHLDAFDQCLHQVLIAAAVGAGACAVVGATLAGPLVHLLLGDGWRDSTPVFIIFASSLPIFLIERVLAIGQRAKGHTASRFKGQAIALIVGSVATLCLSAFGTIGCALGTTIGILMAGVYSTTALSGRPENTKAASRILAISTAAAAFSALGGLAVAGIR